MTAYRDFLAHSDILPVITPIDLAAGANSGLWIPLRNFNRGTFVYYGDPGTSGQEATLTLQRAKSAAGASAANWAAITKAYVKNHATALPTDWTEVVQAAAATFTVAATGDLINLWAFDIDPNAIDPSGSWTHCTVNIADTGATTGKLGSVIFIGQRARYASNRPASAA